MPTDKEVLRRRKCEECDNTFFTEEVAYKVGTEKGGSIWSKLNELREKQKRRELKK